MYAIHMQKTIRDYLPPRTKPKKMMVQARINSVTFTQTKKIMDQEGLSWTDVVTACLNHFIDDRVGQSRSKTERA